MMNRDRPLKKIFGMTAGLCVALSAGSLSATQGLEQDKTRAMNSYTRRLLELQVEAGKYFTPSAVREALPVTKKLLASTPGV